MSMLRKGCSVATTFTVEELAHLASRAVGANELERFAWCELEPGHEGEWHYALGQAANDGRWWLRWKPTGRELLVRESCTAKGEPLPVPPKRPSLYPKPPHLDVEEPEVPQERPCLLFAEHPGAHSFDLGVFQGQARRPALSVGQVRRAWQSLADDTPIRIGATDTGVLTENGAEVLVQATGEAWLQSSPPSGVRGAAVLLAGLGDLPAQVTAPEGEPEPGDTTAGASGKSKVPAYLTDTLLDQLRNTVAALQAGDHTVTLSSFVQDAVAAAIEEAEGKHNGGRPFPPPQREALDVDA
ncbi:MAG TPA: hypothetical protein VN520_19220 [Streptomyces sp.]|uniref:hypothetical protein n=1 Tax=Streptomyces sp. TaxID=1931 RepID=UPI002BB14E4C|nr:hypothetical protein [Streptomyces sp.]HWU08480.1 hypothetical protein [Streptomyces sp.]